MLINNHAIFSISCSSIVVRLSECDVQIFVRVHERSMYAYKLLVFESARLKYRGGEGKVVRIAIPELTKRLQNATVC